MKLFQIINEKGVPVMKTSYISCIPTDEQLSSMLKCGFKFKIDNRAASLKTIKEIRAKGEN